MTTKEFNRLASRVRYLLFQYAVRYVLENRSRRPAAIKFLERNYLDLDHLEHNFSGSHQSPTFRDLSVICDQCNPLDLIAFPDQIDLVWGAFDSLVSAADLMNSSLPLIGINPIIQKEAIGLLKTQSVNVSNRFEDLQAVGAGIDESVYHPLAKEASLAADVLWRRLYVGEDSISSDELQYYKARRQDTIFAPAEYFLEDLERLCNYLLKLLRANPVLTA